MVRGCLLAMVREVTVAALNLLLAFLRVGCKKLENRPDSVCCPGDVTAMVYSKAIQVGSESS